MNEQTWGSRFAVSDHGGMTKLLFNAFLKHHVGPWLLQHGRPGTKIILIDGDGSHEPELETIQWLNENDIHLFRLPAHLTQYLCPLDVSVFGKLKSNYRTLLRDETHRGTVNIGVALRRQLMDKALAQISPSTVTSGWKRSGLYPFDENKWKTEKWAESSIPFCHNSAPREQPNVRHSPRIVMNELRRISQDGTQSADKQLDNVRQLIRANPSNDDILQSALPCPQKPTVPRRAGRLGGHGQMAWISSDDGQKAVTLRKERVAEEQKKVLRRAKAKQSLAKIKELLTTAEEAEQRTRAPRGAETGDTIVEANTARLIALEVVKVHETHGVGKTYATRARRLIASLDRHTAARQVKLERPSEASAPLGEPDVACLNTEASKENDSSTHDAGSQGSSFLGAERCPTGSRSIASDSSFNPHALRV